MTNNKCLKSSNRRLHAWSIPASSGKNVTFGAVLDELFDEKTDNVNGNDTDEIPKSERNVNDERDDSFDDDDSIPGFVDASPAADADDDVQVARDGAIIITGFLLETCDDLLTVSVFVVVRSFGDPFVVVAAADSSELALMTERIGDSAKSDGAMSSTTLTLSFLSVFLIICFTAKRSPERGLTTSVSFDEGDDEDDDDEVVGVVVVEDDVQYSHQPFAVAPRPPLAAQTSRTMMVMDMICRRRSVRCAISSLDDDDEEDGDVATEEEYSVDSASVNARAAAAALKSMTRLVFVVVDDDVGVVVVAVAVFVLVKMYGVRPAAAVDVAPV